MTDEQQRYYTAMNYVLQEGEFGCCRNPLTGKLEFRIGDGHSVMRDLQPVKREG